MNNEKFNQAVDEIVGFIVRAQEAQMELLKHNIRAAYEANVSEIDPNEIAQQIMNMPIGIELRSLTGTELPPPARHLQNEMVCTAEKSRSAEEIGNLADLSYVKVGSDKLYGKEFYHHCPEVEDGLVRLIQFGAPDVHECPVCRKRYERK